MTIKVIKKGKSDWKPTYRGNCRTCECCVICNQDDGRYVGSMRNGTEGDFVEVVCPNCASTIICYHIKEQPYYDPRESHSGYWDR